MQTDPYADFIERKTQLSGDSGFTPLSLPSFLFDFQSALVDWAVRKGRAAIFADCGLGKSPMQLVWADNIVRHTNKPVLILCPLSVSHQTVREGEKFGIECYRSQDGKTPSGASVVVTNYERLHLFNPQDFAGCVCDESSCLKNFDGVRTGEITDFMRKMPYRLLCSATPSPNDYIELGTSSESLGEMGYMDMLSRFFKNDQNSNHPNRLWAGGAKWRFRGHAEKDFWRWVCSWARCIRRPSDLGFEDRDFVLPCLNQREYVVSARYARAGQLFDTPAENRLEELEEQRRTLPERCQKVAELVSDTGKPALIWCHLNPEGDLLTKLIPGAVQVAGSDSDERKEEAFAAFASGEIQKLVTKPKIAAFGMNFQQCDHMTFFPSHSFEQYYQGIRRCWRFGQKNPVNVEVITSEGQAGVLKNLQRKAAQSEILFARLVEHMNAELKIVKTNRRTNDMEVPSWVL